MNWMFAHKSFIDNGIRVAGASDYGPGPFEPLMASKAWSRARISVVTCGDHNSESRLTRR